MTKKRRKRLSATSGRASLAIDLRRWPRWASQCLVSSVFLLSLDHLSFSFPLLRPHSRAGPGKFDAAALSGHPRTALIEQPLEAHLQPKPDSAAASASSSGSDSPGARHTHASGEECEGELSRAELLTASANLANVVNHSDFARLKEAYARATLMPL